MRNYKKTCLTSITLVLMAVVVKTTGENVENRQNLKTRNLAEESLSAVQKAALFYQTYRPLDDINPYYCNKIAPNCEKCNSGIGLGTTHRFCSECKEGRWRRALFLKEEQLILEDFYEKNPNANSLVQFPQLGCKQDTPKIIVVVIMGIVAVIIFISLLSYFLVQKKKSKSGYKEAARMKMYN